MPSGRALSPFDPLYAPAQLQQFHAQVSQIGRHACLLPLDAVDLALHAVGPLVGRPERWALPFGARRCIALFLSCNLMAEPGEPSTAGFSMALGGGCCLFPRFRLDV